MRQGRFVVIRIAVGLTAAGLVLAAPAAAKPGADLSATKAAALGPAAAGQKLSAAYGVKNSGSKPAPRSSVAFHLSVNKKLDKKDIALKGRAGVKPLAPGKSAKGKANVKVPPKVKLGVFRLIACATAKRLDEPNERNNCRTSKPLGVTPLPRPFTVGAIPDPARAATAEIPREGGSLSATAADGTRFTLSFPDGALLSAERITMTPLASIDGFPLSGGMAGGVQLEPDGLGLLKPAMLRIEPATPVGEAERTGFAYRGSGQEFHLYPTSGDGGAITLELLRFSGYGAGSASPGERASFADDNPPSSVLDQADQQRAAEQELQAMALALHAQILALANDRGTFQLAVLYLQAWAGQLGPLYGSARAYVTAQLDRHATEARLRCFANRDLREAAWLMSLGALAQQLGVFSSAASTSLEACLRFELDLDADLTESGGIEPTTVRGQAASVPARLISGVASESFQGEKSLSVLAYSVSDYGCYTHTWEVTPSAPVRVQRIRFTGLNPLGGFGPAPLLHDVSLDPGNLEEQVTHNCPDPPDNYTVPQNIYRDAMISTLGDGTVSGWTDAGGGTFRRELPAGEGYTGQVVLVLRHTPTAN